MARPELTLPRFLLVVAIFFLGLCLIPKLYDQAPGMRGLRTGKIPREAVYMEGARAKAPWGDVFVRVRPHEEDPLAFTFEVYSGTTGDLLSQCELKADGGMPPNFDPRDLVGAGPSTLTYLRPQGTPIELHLSAGTWPLPPFH